MIGSIVKKGKKKILKVGILSITILKKKFFEIFNFFTKQSWLLMVLDKNTFENIVGKEEYAGIQHFLLFTQCFLPIPKRISNSNLYLFCRQQMLWIWTCLNPFPNYKFWLFQTERVCRRQFWTWWKWQKVCQMGRKHCGKRRNCLLRAISPFPTEFSKDFYCRHIKTRACLGKG